MVKNNDNKNKNNNNSSNSLVFGQWLQTKVAKNVTTWQIRSAALRRIWCKMQLVYLPVSTPINTPVSE